ncbi:homoaconitate hydratase family protein [Trichodesmium erythraeum IMS101]|uniref:Homoaconitate hydratase family protein n=1 Tax=Trichodesmium erythraeum (strain IMS101) TaxID=203124 RepID=Q111B2_TRIEI|nr:3-isopropylmalate dehydratase large subunit [Trichodesmium erythraeum GBRTRLIN201]MDT9341203.1 3-isopropylmalate dehydratase large subunit [Trichodesmium erythraeum 21-75]
MTMTMVEKILAKASGKSTVNPGENIWVNVDVLMTHDVCGPGTIGIFKREFGENAKVWDKEKIVLIPDHYIFTADERANRNVDILRDFAQEQNIKYFYDIIERSNFKANPDYKGVCHVALAQEGHTRPGEVLFGTDSHTCNAGAFGEFATGIGNTDAAFIAGTGKLLVKVPATMRFILNGEMPNYLLAKDLILQIIGDISVSGATYRTMEFAGETVGQMTMEERMTLCNMVIEAGGKNGVIAPDEMTFEYLRGRTDKPFESFYSDKNAEFYSDRSYDVTKLEPVVAKPHSPDNKELARNCQDVKIDRVYIGSCTGGKTSDFLHAAKLIKDHQVKVPTYLVPATQKVYEDLFIIKHDGKTLSEIFLDAGCIEPAAPSCAACLGGPKDTFGRLNEPEICVSTTNRNFPGRMGNKQAQVYLASPYTAAASALTGYVTDPREFM